MTVYTVNGPLCLLILTARGPELHETEKVTSWYIKIKCGPSNRSLRINGSVSVRYTLYNLRLSVLTAWSLPLIWKKAYLQILVGADIAPGRIPLIHLTLIFTILFFLF